jgi:hypothetical protein
MFEGRVISGLGSSRDDQRAEEADADGEENGGRDSLGEEDDGEWHDYHGLQGEQQGRCRRAVAT